MFIRKTTTTHLQKNTLFNKRRERIISRKKTPTPVRITSLFTLIFTPLLISTIVYFLFSYFSVKHVYCTDSENSSCPPELISQLQQFQNKPLIFLNTQANTANLIKDFPQFDQLSSRKQYPNSLYFEPHKSPPEYCISLDQKNLLVLASGKVTEIDQLPPNLPVIKFFNDPTIDTQQLLDTETHQTIQSTLEFSKQLQLFQITWFDKNQIQLEMQNGKKILIKSENLDEQFRKIETILNKQVEIENWKELDVRFQHPVAR